MAKPLVNVIAIYLVLSINVMNLFKGILCDKHKIFIKDKKNIKSSNSNQHNNQNKSSDKLNNIKNNNKKGRPRVFGCRLKVFCLL